MELSMYGDLGLLILRLAIGAVFLAHGPMKLTKTKEMSAGLGLSTTTTMAVGIVETVGAVAMILGLWANIAALGLIAVMVGAIYFKTQKWGKKFTGENGWELDFMVATASLTILLVGAGIYTI